MQQGPTLELIIAQEIKKST